MVFSYFKVVSYINCIFFKVEILKNGNILKDNFCKNKYIVKLESKQAFIKVIFL